MGNVAYRNQLSCLIDQDQADQMILICREHPELINSQLNLDNHHTPLIRAIYRQNYTIASILLGDFSADPNLAAGRYTPLMAAAVRDNTELIDLLLYFKGDPKKQSSEGLNTLDCAILFGSYKSALHLMEKLSMQIGKSVEEFQKLRKKWGIPYVNYDLMIQYLEQGVCKQKAIKKIFKKQGIISSSTVFQSTSWYDMIKNHFIELTTPDIYFAPFNASSASSVRLNSDNMNIKFHQKNSQSSLSTNSQVNTERNKSKNLQDALMSINEVKWL